MQLELALIAAAASFVGAWIAARLAFARFSREKVWERKAAAYTAIFEALHYIGRWHEKHYEAALIKEEINEEKRKKLQAEANTAEDELERRLASETWLIPPECRARLEKMITDLKNSAFKHRSSWDEYLDDSCFIVKTASDDLRSMVVQDLGLNAKWYRETDVIPPKGSNS
jgi:hypothetical protein